MLIDTRGRVSLADFGVARLLTQESIVATVHRNFLGTSAYAAPELWDGGQATPASDIYALGCIVVELLTGEPLFAQETALKMALAHVRGAVLPDAWPPGTPLGVRDVLAVALAVDPSQRFPTARALWDRLASAASAAPSQHTEARQGTPAPEAPQPSPAPAATPPAQRPQARVFSTRRRQQAPVPASTIGQAVRSRGELVFAWTVAHIIAGSIGVTLLIASGSTVYSYAGENRLISTAIMGAMGGLVVGVAEQVSMQRYLPLSKLWMLVTLIGYSLGSVVGMWIMGGVIAVFHLMEESAALYFSGFGFILGACVGVHQWLVLRRSAPDANRWSPATALAAGLSSGASIWNVEMFVSLSGKNLLRDAVIGAVGGLIYGLSTAIMLIWLFRSKR